ncbi:hypothetical protein [Neobacillus drentensis]|uniref:hypothetical protein n=1 Tax=Neobacillus drentensis TaxID=220684 RepID=UPI003000A438
MKKWAISAIVYLLVVIGCYTFYDVYFNKEADHGETNTHEASTSAEEHGHGHEEGEVKAGEVKTTFVYNKGKITIVLNDENGKPVDDLKVNHEKLLHLIVVDEHLDQYCTYIPKR